MVCRKAEKLTAKQEGGDTDSYTVYERYAYDSTRRCYSSYLSKYVQEASFENAGRVPVQVQVPYILLRTALLRLYDNMMHHMYYYINTAFLSYMYTHRDEARI